MLIVVIDGGNNDLDFGPTQIGWNRDVDREHLKFLEVIDEIWGKHRGFEWVCQRKRGLFSKQEGALTGLWVHLPSTVHRGSA